MRLCRLVGPLGRQGCRCAPGSPYTPVRAAVRFGARELDDGEYYPGPGGYAFDGLLFEDEYNTGRLRALPPS